MVDPDYELQRFRWELHNLQYHSHDINEICDQILTHINETVIDIVSNTTAEAVMFAEDLGAEEFISDVDVSQNGWIYSIGTRSGKTDFSVDRVENLPNLLKNAKTAKDGTRYKVIPLKEKNKKPKMGNSMFETMRIQQSVLSAQRDTMLADNANRSARARSVADGVRQNLNRTMIPKDSAGPTTAFRTASSNQNPSSQWVIPEIDRDMTQYLYDLNQKMSNNIQDAISSIFSSYKQEYT